MALTLADWAIHLRKGLRGISANYPHHLPKILLVDLTQGDEGPSAISLASFLERRRESLGPLGLLTELGAECWRLSPTDLSKNASVSAVKADIVICLGFAPGIAPSLVPDALWCAYPCKTASATIPSNVLRLSGSVWGRPGRSLKRIDFPFDFGGKGCLRPLDLKCTGEQVGVVVGSPADLHQAVKNLSLEVARAEPLARVKQIARSRMVICNSVDTSESVSAFSVAASLGVPFVSKQVTPWGIREIDASSEKTLHFTLERLEKDDSFRSEIVSTQSKIQELSLFSGPLSDLNRVWMKSVASKLAKVPYN